MIVFLLASSVLSWLAVLCLGFLLLGALRMAEQAATGVSRQGGRITSSLN